MSSVPPLTSPPPDALGRTCRIGRYVFAQGLVGAGADCATQLGAAMEHLDVVLRAGGSTLDRVERVTFYVKHATDLPEDPGGAWFLECRPRVTIVEYSALPSGVRVEIEATATRGGPE